MGDGLGGKKKMTAKPKMSNKNKEIAYSFLSLLAVKFILSIMGTYQL